MEARLPLAPLSHLELDVVGPSLPLYDFVLFLDFDELLKLVPLDLLPTAEAASVSAVEWIRLNLKLRDILALVLRTRCILPLLRLCSVRLYKCL